MEREKLHRENYANYVRRMATPSRYWPSLLWAFLIGGLISIMGQGLYHLYDHITEYDPAKISGLVAITLIGIAAILTGFGVYDRIGNVAGGGSIVPITGFSNAVTAAAMEHRKEGIIFGTCTNMFKIAGPVIVMGVFLSMLVGTVYWVISLF
ncbi:MAG: SpoVA/SpoVAEb family sporulation membrane protein [Firmicutes bacterium]|nr:SpoVA/SpoVAEb family sporulation membrane protein [Bacillota bacterium]